VLKRHSETLVGVLFVGARRLASLASEVAAIWEVALVGVVVLVAITFFVRRYEYSRGVVFLFTVVSGISLSAFRLSIRGVLRELRRRGRNLRYVLVIGSGRLAEELIERVHHHAEVGLRIVGVLSDDRSLRHVRGAPVLGGYGDVKPALARHPADQVIVALPRTDTDQLEKILAALQDETVSVSLVPDLFAFMTLRSSAEEFDGVPMIGLRESPLVGWSAVQKRAFDILVSGLVLLATSPLTAAVALAIRASSGAPVLYVQERMGLDGRLFRMLKFRTMRPGAEDESGPVWARADDPRRTRLGAFLRRWNLDELPQLWNVFRGDMSLVGPRPERPELIARFRHEIPGYMLRHTVKAGLTGWAQVHGWRGDTSLHERIEHDLYYIQNWSLGLDVRILLMTLWRGFRNAY
jgi:Undecaprenyl-phosphate glucose phosphotransferase